MKYYETALNEYVEAVERYNLHNNHPLMSQLKAEKTVNNMIFYGPSGVGKYSQMLYLLSTVVGRFKFQQKLFIQKDVKEKYTYTMSDIYFEIDMGLLGCNSKTLWHEIYLQILDIVAIKPNRMGIIVCKNFHLIHSELLEIFYSYIQDNYKWKDVKDITIKYILLTEQISFISNNIVSNFIVINFPRPTMEDYRRVIEQQMAQTETEQTETVQKETAQTETEMYEIMHIDNIKSLYNTPFYNSINMCEISATISNTNNKNNKGNKSNKSNKKGTLDVVCDAIIKEIENADKIVITEFRDLLYEILTYGLDIGECLWYMLSYFHKYGINIDIELLDAIYDFLTKFNNNYRPITHLESIFIKFINHYNNNNNIVKSNGSGSV